MSEKELRIILAGGGTGGHLYPAIAIAEEMKALRPKVDIVFVGTKGKIESRVVPEKGYDLKTIWVGGWSRRLSLGMVLFPFKLMVSFIQSYVFIKKFRPHVVVGTGGYVSGPVLYVATLLRIPTLIQEQNSYPGIASRLLAGRVDEVHVTFEVTKKYLKKGKRKIKVSGNPTRAALGTVKREHGALFFGLDAKKKTVLVFGGSLGAVRLNDAILTLVQDLIAADIQLIWQTGTQDYDRIKSAAPLPNLIAVVSFIDRMEFAYAASDVVVCRAGATTVAEITRVGIPAILVPYPYAAADHQVVNASTVADSGAAIVVLEHELPGKLRTTLFNLLESRSERKKMSKRSLTLARPHAGRDLAEAAMRLALLRSVPWASLQDDSSRRL